MIFNFVVCICWYRWIFTSALHTGSK